MARTAETDVLVVGAGPVGLFTALALAERGVRVQIVDRDQRTSAHSYALALHARTLGMFDRHGIAGGLVGQGTRVRKMALFDARERRADLDLTCGAEAAFPFVLVLPQSRLEAALEAKLEEHGVHVLWNHRAQNLEPERDGTVAEIAILDRVASGYPIARMEWVVARTFRTRASWVVGADGYHSLVRRKLGLKHLDLGGAQVFSVFEFETESPLPTEAALSLLESGINAYWPLSEHRGRWSFQIHDGSEHRSTIESLRALLAERVPWFDAEPKEIHWTSAVHFDRRLAARFGNGNTWLAGDSVHLTGPVGVQSMNVGLLEAESLAVALIEAGKGGGVAALEAYNEARDREWRRLLQVDSTVTATGDADPWIRERADRILPCIPASGDDLTAILAQIGLVPPA